MSANPTAPVWPLQHWAGLSGRIMLKQGPRATSVTEADLDDLLVRVRKGVTGIVRRAGVALDESQLMDLQRTYFPANEAEGGVVVVDVERDFEDDDFGPNVNEHGWDMTPGCAPRWAAL